MSKLSQDELKRLFRYDPETGVFTRLVTRGKHIAGTIAGTIDDDGYVRITVDGKKYRAQRLAFRYMTGAFPECEVDHADRVRTNNVWANLREATTQQNAANKIGHARDLPKGVSAVGDRFTSRIKVGGKRYRLGVFDTVDAAQSAYMKAANDHFGQYARAA